MSDTAIGHPVGSGSMPLPTAEPRVPRPLNRGASSVRLRAIRIVRAIVPFVLLVTVWWLVKVIYDLPDRVLVSPAKVLSTSVELIRLGILPDYLASSLTRLLKATALSVLIGAPVGLLMGSSRLVARATEQFMRFLLAMSAVAWLPLVIIWYGLSDTTVFVIVVYTASLPIILNTVTGLRSIPERYLESVRTLGAGRLREVRDVYLPGAFASMVVGIRLAIGYGWRALIAGEMILGLNGIGHLIFSSRLSREVDRIMAGMITIGVAYIIFDRLVLKPLESITSHTSSGT